MDTTIFGPLALKHILVPAGVVIAAFIIFAVVKKFFKKKAPSEYTQLVECRGCGWQGRVSRLAGRCPACNTPLGDQRVQPKK
jgi:predicted Zn-ribbon and HTH transcriptional regulator